MRNNIVSKRLKITLILLVLFILCLALLYGFAFFYFKFAPWGKKGKRLWNKGMFS